MQRRCWITRLVWMCPTDQNLGQDTQMRIKPPYLMFRPTSKSAAATPPRRSRRCRGMPPPRPSPGCSRGTPGQAAPCTLCQCLCNKTHARSIKTVDLYNLFYLPPSNEENDEMSIVSDGNEFVKCGQYEHVSKHILLVLASTVLLSP